MKRKVLIAVLILPIVFSGFGFVVQAKPDKPAFKLPASAKQLTDTSYSLGKKLDPTSGKEVEGIAYIHKKQEARFAAKPGGGSKPCYAFIASGLKWKVVEPWLLDSANSHGLASDFLLSNTAANIAKWESAANANIFGSGSLATGLVIDEATPDGQNEVVFGGIDGGSSIAVTVVWGYYNAPTKFREIVEWDQIFDDQDFGWSASGESDKMDFNNISTHELGHAAGMGHPANTCTEETIYAYAGFGEIKKSSLNPGDIAGINALY